MFENQILMRSYKEIKNNHKHLKLEKEFEEDNYLIQTLKRTSKVKYDRKIIEDQNNLKSLLSEITTEFLIAYKSFSLRIL